jgi:methyl-accepting chemotaxis protein
VTRKWTFARKIAAGFAVVVALSVAVDLVSAVTLKGVVASKNRVINVNSRRLEQGESLRASAAEKSSAARGYLLTGNKKYLDEVRVERQAFKATLADLRQSLDAAGQPALATIEADESTSQGAIDSVVALRRSGASVTAMGEEFTVQVDPKHAQLVSDIATFIASEEKILVDARRASNETASKALILIEVLAAFSTVLAAGLAFVLTRTLRRQIGTAVAEVRSSSAELQATANEQASGAKEQAMAIREITTTISELLATSRQIGESAQRVAQVADRTAITGRSGVETIGKAQTFITDVRTQVDVIVDHMLALGEKSQRIGEVLDIVLELAEQTNILAINSTIEAAGAGEAGKRFAVVADEIRKLADRVADSTKEIRALIDVVRAAVNTTVMATEIGSKAVDAGNQQFDGVSEAFDEIAGLTTTAFEAAREIELSTKQQTTAVEQVNVAISNVAQSTKEAEASSSQTFQTASQLSALSKELSRLVEPQSAG